ncbi:DUF3367 domain-containing protein [Corynebacterium sp. TA-R-1]|uniref:DUF3367 domain-containing protein n=1 Tax=Corynebacterium stercoris TaxID=2943490 RepID=A0ABT1G0L2_9CORY|nr:alpha-(1->3)-arabinofuranosyltransferase family protein [Corynebacterium stercoris]MCP1387569.1 DUF3367 domain-containing protein [Corynebacterium stercoris]
MGARLAHALGWLALGLLAFLQQPGRVAADTKFDLTANPGGFLRRALHAWTDDFTLGQMQNQAYGYLFPQGAWFWLADLLGVPDWIAQRLWWTLLVGLAYSGTLVLARRVLGPRVGWAGPVVAAVLYALSPRVLTTLTAISSEAWPVALVPWTLVPLVGRRPNVAAAIVPVAFMGGVNATATIAACVPAGLYLLWRREWLRAAGFGLGAAAVSAWWLGPLVVLGRYSPPFTDFIESATVTTSWLSPAEILRGTTSWAPFVDAERTAGFLLVAEPTFVLATCAVAAVGLAGLARRDMPQRGAFVLVLSVGFALLASAHFAVSLYDATFAAFRNLHKFDSLVRLPLCLGAGWAVTVLAADVGAGGRHAAGRRAALPGVVGVVLVAAVAVAPAWSLRLMPQGTWDEVSPDWVAVGEWLTEHAAGTRTIVVPAASFARQEWGWTRDEPIQALASVPFAVRDAIPLVDPEAIRGLDGQVAALDAEALRSIGVGAVVVRRDLDKRGAGRVLKPQPGAIRELGEPAARFGDVAIYMLEPERGMMLTADEPLTVDAGGEALPLLWRELGYFPARLVGGGGAGSGAAVITDTPALAARNYGTLDGQSAHLADLDEDGSVSNRVKDYPSSGTRAAVAMEGRARASSSAADAGAFGGPNPAKSLTSAFDGLENTAWWPAPGDEAAWVSVDTQSPTMTITATDTTRVELSDGERSRTVTLVGGEPRTVAAAPWIRLTEPAGIAEIDAGITRIVDVPGTGDAYFFQRRFPATDVLQRRFTTAVDAEWTLSAPARIDGAEVSGTVRLPAGTHELVTSAETVLLSRELRLPSWEPFAGTVEAADRDRILLTTRAFNDGLRASVGGVPLEPVRIDAASQAFIVPAGASGDVAMWHAGDRVYRGSLFFGGAFSLVVLAGCLWVPWRRFEWFADAGRTARLAEVLPPTLAAVAAGPLAGLVAVAVAWVVRRFTLIRASWLASGAMAAAGLWLARAPWPTPGYAGDSWLLAVAGCLAVAALAWPDDANATGI